MSIPPAEVIKLIASAPVPPESRWILASCPPAKVILKSSLPAAGVKTISILSTALRSKPPPDELMTIASATAWAAVIIVLPAVEAKVRSSSTLMVAEDVPSIVTIPDVPLPMLIAPVVEPVPILVILVLESVLILTGAPSIVAAPPVQAKDGVLSLIVNPPPPIPPT